jgi:hypothetical protein
MVVVIIEKESDLTWSELHGFDIEAEWIGDDSFYNDIKKSDDSMPCVHMICGSVCNIQV